MFRELVKLGVHATAHVARRAITGGSGSSSCEEHVERHHVPVSGSSSGGAFDNGAYNLAVDAVSAAKGVAGAAKDIVKGNDQKRSRALKFYGKPSGRFAVFFWLKFYFKRDIITYRLLIKK